MVHKGLENLIKPKNESTYVEDKCDLCQKTVYFHNRKKTLIVISDYGQYFIISEFFKLNPSSGIEVIREDALLTYNTVTFCYSCWKKELLLMKIKGYRQIGQKAIENDL